MFNKRIWHKLVTLIALGISTAQVGIASAQWGNNAPPCPSHCAPASPWWGYVQTRWTRWPGATYPDMVKPGTSGGEEIPAPGVELPKPNRETEIHSLPSAAANKGSGAGSAMETPHDSTTEPAPATPSPEAQPSPEIEPSPNLEPAPNPSPSPETKPSDMPSLKQAPGATPPSDNPFFTPPSNPEPAPATPPGSSSPSPGSPTVPPGGSSAIPKPRLHAPISKTYAGTSEIHVLNGQSAANAETKETMVAKPLRLRLDADDFTRPLSPNQEPQLIVPSMASRPLPALNLETLSQPAATAAGNPLRYDPGSRAVVPVNNPDVIKSEPNSSGSVMPQGEVSGNAVISGG